MSSIKHAGGPWELGLAETHQVFLQSSSSVFYLVLRPDLV